MIRRTVLLVEQFSKLNETTPLDWVAAFSYLEELRSNNDADKKIVPLVLIWVAAVAIFSIFWKLVNKDNPDSSVVVNLTKHYLDSAYAGENIAILSTTLVPNKATKNLTSGTTQIEYFVKVSRNGEAKSIRLNIVRQKGRFYISELTFE